MEQYWIHESDRVITGETYSSGFYARAMHPDGKPYHTFRTSTLLVDGDRVTFDKCLFENTAGSGKEVGQAIALYLDGEDILVKDCVIRGHQDTLFLAPLPPWEIEPDGFLGPKQFTPRKNHTYHFENCRIEGGVDFVFGGATAYFDRCEFVNVEPGYVFAPNTPEDVKTGFVARDCRFIAGEDVPEGSCYIGRPWRNYAKIRLEHCYLGSHMHPEGFHDWNKPEAHETMEFVEIGSYGPGYYPSARPDYVTVIE